MLTVQYTPQKDKPYWSRKNCQHLVLQNPNAPDEKKYRCKHKVRYIVNGKGLCQLHAGYACLLHALEESNKRG